MDYEVAIPSYRRHTVLPKKTWATLIDGGVPMEQITVFVASAEEAVLYRAALPEGAKVVVGRHGLVNQRDFIHSYYPTMTKILFVDDDLTQIKALEGDKLVRVEDVDAFIQYGFEEAVSRGSMIWGIYPAASSMYMKVQPPVTTDLKYIIGALYGIINDHPPVLTMGDNQEDKVRTLMYWTRYKKIVRLNHFTILTRYYAPGGMESPTRKAETDASTAQLVAAFPGLVKRVWKPKSGIWDIRFIPQREAMDGEETEVSVLPLRAGYAEAKAALLTELAKVTIPTLGKESSAERRAHHGTRADNIGTIGRTATLGYGRTRMYGIAEFRFNKKWPALLRALINFGNVIAPVGWKYTAITLNHGVKARRHKDTTNVGRSIIIGIGDYEGGDLRVWTPDDASFADMDLRDRPTMFNGALLAHETQPFTGNRFTIIYYKQKWDGACKDMPQMEGAEVTPAGGAGI
jgi:hypothetical protein